MLAKLDWKDIIAWLLFFVPGVLKGFQTTLAGGQKLDVMTILMIILPVLVGSYTVLKTPGSATSAPMLSAKAKVLGFIPAKKPPSKK